MTTRKNLPVLLDDGEMIGYLPNFESRYCEIPVLEKVAAVFDYFPLGLPVAPPMRTIRLEKDRWRGKPPGDPVGVLAWRVPKDISFDDLEYLRREVETRGVK